MADEENGAAVAAADDTTAADTTTPDPKVEAEAREMGWRPKDQFKGKPEDWRPAEEFVKRGREVLPIVNAENKRLKAELERVRRDADDRIARIEKMSSAALKAQRSEIEGRYEAQIEKAAEAGDVKAVRAARAAQKDALKDFDKAAEDAADDKAKPGGKANGKDETGLSVRDQAIWSDWVSENSWFTESAKLRGAADEAFDDLKKEMPGASFADILDAVRERVAEEFPAKFGKKAGNGSKVEGSGDRGGGDAGGKADLWSKVPTEARTQADRFIRKEGLFLGKGEDKDNLTPAQLKAARERYAKEYLA